MDPDPWDTDGRRPCPEDPRWLDRWLDERRDGREPVALPLERVDIETITPDPHLL